MKLAHRSVIGQVNCLGALWDLSSLQLCTGLSLRFRESQVMVNRRRVLLVFTLVHFDDVMFHGNFPNSQSWCRSYAVGVIKSRIAYYVEKAAWDGCVMVLHITSRPNVFLQE